MIPKPSDIESEIKAIESLKTRTVTVWSVVKWAFITCACVSASYILYGMKQKTDLIPAIQEQQTQTAMTVSEIKSTLTEQGKQQVLQGKDIKDLKQSVRIMRFTLPDFSKKLDEINRITEEDKEQTELMRSVFENDTISLPQEQNKKLQINIKKL